MRGHRGLSCTLSFIHLNILSLFLALSHSYTLHILHLLHKMLEPYLQQQNNVSIVQGNEEDKEKKGTLKQRGQRNKGDKKTMGRCEIAQSRALGIVPRCIEDTRTQSSYFDGRWQCTKRTAGLGWIHGALAAVFRPSRGCAL